MLAGGFWEDRKCLIKVKQTHGPWPGWMLSDGHPEIVSALLQETLKRGDGLVFDSGAPDGDEEGGTIYNVDQSKQRSARSGSCVDLKFGPGQLNLRRVKVPPPTQ